LLGDQLGGFELAVAEFGVLVQVVPDLHHPGRDLLHHPVDLRVLSEHAARDDDECDEYGGET
jgi:hypothetical protein